MKRLHWLVVCAALSGLIACGDDDGGGTDSGTPGTDGGGEDAGETMVDPPECPSGDNIPDEEGLMGACCYRVSNADRLANPEFRVSALRITEPTSLSSALVRGALNDAIDEERFNWLIRVGGAEMDGAITVETGYGERNMDATFAFTMGGAPAPGDPDRWNPLTADATLAGETITADALSGAFTVPIFEDDLETLSLELPLQAFELQMANMSEDRSCIGLRDGRVYQTSEGTIRTYITIADAMAGRVVIPPIDTTLCNFVAGMAASSDPCTDTPRADWPVPPNALCEDGVCTETCDVADCNAWRIAGGFGAHGVEIAD